MPKAVWLCSRFRISEDSITVRVLGREHVHPKQEIVELRWVWLPWPDLVVVSRAEGDYQYSTFQLLRWSRLRSALARFGYPVPCEVRYYSMSLLRQDVARYQLSDCWREGGGGGGAPAP